jgi:hypothetical protein
MLLISIEDDHPSLKHPRVYALADMLDTPDLKALATKKLQIQLKNWVAADFPAMVRELYFTTNKQDKKIRSALVSVAKDHIDELLEVEKFKEVIEEFGEFSAALLVVVRTPPPPNPSPKCKCKCNRNATYHFCSNCL